MPGSFIRSLVQRGSGLAFPAIKPNKIPYFSPMAARSGQGYRIPFAKIPTGIPPRLGNFQSLSNSGNAAEMTKRDNEAGQSVLSESTGLPDKAKVPTPITQSDSMMAEVNSEKQEHGPFSEDSALDGDSYQSQPDPMDSETSLRYEADTQPPASRKIDLPTEPRPSGLFDRAEIASEDRSSSNFQTSDLGSQTLPDIQNELDRKSGVIEPAQEAASPVDSFSLESQADQRELNSSPAIRNQADVVSSRSEQNSIPFPGEIDPATHAKLGEIEATTLPNPEPRLAS